MKPTILLLPGASPLTSFFDSMTLVDSLSTTEPTFHHRYRLISLLFIGSINPFIFLLVILLRIKRRNMFIRLLSQ